MVLSSPERGDGTRPTGIARARFFQEFHGLPRREKAGAGRAGSACRSGRFRFLIFPSEGRVMMSMLHAYVPGLVESVMAEFVASGRATIPAGRRDEVVRMLQSVVCGRIAVDEYSELLGAALPADAVPPEAPTEFSVETIFRDGLGVLTDDQLARLALNIVTLDELCDRIVAEEVAMSDRLGPWWQVAYEDIVIPPEYDAAAERAIAEFHRVERATRPT